MPFTSHFGRHSPEFASVVLEAFMLGEKYCIYNGNRFKTKDYISSVKQDIADGYYHVKVDSKMWIKG